MVTIICRSVWYNPCGSLRTRYRLYNKCLENIIDHIKTGINKSWENNIDRNNEHYINPRKRDFPEGLNVEEVTIVYLEFRERKIQSGLFYEQAKTDTSNLLLNRYYQPVGSKQLCKNVTGKNNDNMGFYYTPYCSTQKQMDEDQLSIDVLNTLQFINNIPNIQAPHYVTYTIIVQNAILAPYGTIISQHMFLLPTKTRMIKWNVPKDYDKAPLYDQVFALGDPDSGNFYHLLVDSISKIVANLEFLQSNPNIKILVPGPRSKILPLFHILKLSVNRIISGIIRAKIAYVPGMGYPCFPHLQNIQIFSEVTRNFIRKPTKGKNRRSVVFIRRTYKRFFANQSEIENMVKEMADEHGLRYEVFSDNPTPEFHDAMKMFNRAVLIFGPHGAGLTNIIFSNPGTIIFEVNCCEFAVALCYTRLAHALGQRYYGYLATKGCAKGIHVNMADLKDDLAFYMIQAVKIINAY